MIQDAPGRNAAKNSVLTKHKFPAKSFFFYLSVKMNRMAKIWCTVPRMIFVGGFRTTCSPFDGRHSEKALYQNLSKPIF